jgi:hypothetical protein
MRTCKKLRALCQDATERLPKQTTWKDVVFYFNLALRSKKLITDKEIEEAIFQFYV